MGAAKGAMVQVELMAGEAKRAYDSVAALYQRSLELRDDIRVSSLVSTYFSCVTHWVLSAVCNGITPSEPSGCSPRDFCRVLAPTVVFIYISRYLSRSELVCPNVASGGTRSASTGCSPREYCYSGRVIAFA